MRVAIGELLLSERPDLLGGIAAVAETITIDTLRFPVTMVQELAKFQPDLILVGTPMLDVFLVLDEYLARADSTETQVVMLSHAITDTLRMRAAYAGFVEIIDLSAPLPVIVRQVEEVSAGTSQLERAELRARVERPLPMRHPGVDARDDHDMEILHMITIGMADSSIADTLGMSVQTVRNRVSQMLLRNGMTNRTQLAWAFVHQALLGHLIMGIANLSVGP